MTTREQELKALEQIEKIIASLGEYSYIGTAMDGMIEDARENIENDFALSMKDRWLEADRKLNGLTEKIETQEAQIRNQAKDLELHDLWLQQKCERIDELNAQLAKAAEDISQKIGEAYDDKMKIEKLELENMKLKAKLYDLIA